MAQWPTVNAIINPDVTEGEQATNFSNWLTATQQLPGGLPQTTLTLAGEAITPNRSISYVAPEGDASSGVLRKIIPTNVADGHLLMLCCASSSRPITIKGSRDQYGLVMAGNQEKALPANHWMVFRLVDNLWHETPLGGSALHGPGLVTAGNEIRIPLTSSKNTIYVRENGNDANDGFTPTTAKATLTGARSVLFHIDGRGINPTIDIGPGRFAIGKFSFWEHHVAVGQTIVFRGAGKSQTTLYGDYWAFCRVRTVIQDMALETRVFAEQHSVVYLNGEIAIKNPIPTDSMIMTETAAVVKINCTVLELYNEAKAFLRCAGNSTIFVDKNAQIKFFNNKFSSVCWGLAGGFIYWPTTTKWTGTATGRRFFTEAGGMIYCGSLLPDDFLPGDAPGLLSMNGNIAIPGANIARASVAANGALTKGYHIASVVNKSAGVYEIKFKHALQNYFALVTPTDTNLAATAVIATGKTNLACTVRTSNGAALANIPFSIAFFAI